MDFQKNNFDLIRLLAAAQVMARHIVGHFGLEDRFGWLSALPGVPIFFVVSGFLVSASYERAPSLKAYAWFRFLRIYPALWVCLFVSMLAAAIIGDVSFVNRDALTWVLAQITIVQFYNPDFLRGYGVGVLNGVLWTIPVELQFYIALPAIYWLLRKLKRIDAVLMLSIALLAVLNVAYVRLKLIEETLVTDLIGITLAPYLYLFLLGVLLQRNLWFVEKYLAGKALLWLTALIGIAWGLGSLGVTVTGNDLNPVSAIVLGLAAVSAAYTRPFIHLRHDISYGIYIYHMLAVNALVELEIVSPWIAAAVTVCLALLSWFAIERPALRLKRKL